MFVKIDYLDRNKEGKDIDIVGFFELVEEGKNFILIKTEKNLVRIPYHRIIKLKGGKI